MLANMPLGSQFEVGVVGAGHISTVYHLPILDTIGNVDVTYVADIDKETAKEAARHHGAEAIHLEGNPSILPDCDVVLLAVPVGVRDEYVREFADRETSIFSEKPFARNRDEHERFLNHSDAVFCNYQRTCYSSVRQARKLIESGMFGELNGATFHEGSAGGTSGLTPDHYRTDIELSGGNILMEFGTHLLSELLFLFHDSEISIEGTDAIWSGDFEVDVKATLRVRNDGSDIEVDYHVSQIKPTGKAVRLEFESAEVVFHPQDAEVPLTVEPTGTMGEEYTLKQETEWATTHHQGVFLRWKEFFSYLEGDWDPTIRTGKTVTDLIETMFEQGQKPERTTVR